MPIVLAQQKVTTMNKCWFCDGTRELRPRERSYDSASLLNDDGTPSFQCADCWEAEYEYRRRCIEMTDAEYATQEEHAARVRDSKEGF